MKMETHLLGLRRRPNLYKKELTMKKKMVGEVPGNLLGMLADLLHKIQNGVIRIEELARFLKRENPFEAPSYHKFINEWEKFYQKVFGLTVDLSQVRVPDPRDGFNLLVVMLQGLTAQKLFDKCKELFRAWKWTDKNLDEILDQAKSVHNPANGNYAIWLRDRVEADEELKNRSANNLQQDNVRGITLEGRLLLELFYYWKTGKHLDVQNWTLCSGSRCFGGSVPDVSWSSGVDRLDVSWYGPGSSDDSLRSRETVS
jgi:hypothetical protein